MPKMADEEAGNSESREGTLKEVREIWAGKTLGTGILPYEESKNGD